MKKLLLASLTFCLTSSAFALNWQMVGARSMAMGGAGVVTAGGTNAQYYNPALLGEVLGEEQTDENGFHIGMQIETPVISDEISESTSEGMSYIKELLQKGRAPLVNSDIGFGLRRGNFAFSIRSLDMMAIAPAQGNTRASTGTASSKVLANAAAFTEAAVGYGFYIAEGVRLGGNLKVIQGTALETGFDWHNDNIDFSDLMRKSWHHKKLSANWGIDLGAAVNLAELFSGNFIFNPDIGFTVRNINSPKFKRPKQPENWTSDWNSDDYKLKPQYRIGAAIHPIADRLTVAADIDLNKNETLINNYKSQQLSLGAEVVVWNDHSFKVPLRVGMNKNLAEDNAPTYVTAGFGTLGHDFDFEFALTAGDRTQKLKGHDWPNALGLSMSFAWYF